MDDVHLCPLIFAERAQLSFCRSLTAIGAKTVVVLTLPDAIIPDEKGRLKILDIVSEARQIVGNDVLLCPAIPVNHLIFEPYGDIPIAQGVAHFHELASFCSTAGADMVMIHRAHSLLQARTAVLGARNAGLPVAVSIETIGEGDTLLGNTDILAAFVVLQELGIAAFGFASSVTALQIDPLKEILPYRKVPIFSITQNLTARLSAEDTNALFEYRAKSLAQLGVGGIGIWGAQQEQLVQAARALVEANPIIEVTDELSSNSLWAANETQVYYLDENIEFSEPLRCRLDMTDDILEKERMVCDALCIELLSADEAHSISLNNGNLDQMPVCFYTDSEAALEAALFYYNGRAIIDSRVPLPEVTVRALAQRYGAVVI